MLSRGEKVREFGLWLYRDTESLHKTTKAIQYMLRWPPPSQSCYSQFTKEDVFNFLNSDKENLAISYVRIFLLRHASFKKILCVCVLRNGFKFQKQGTNSRQKNYKKVDHSFIRPINQALINFGLRQNLD